MSSQRKLNSGTLIGGVQRHPQGACDFILEGLSVAVEQVHGPLTPAQALLAQYMAHEDIDLHEVAERREEGLLDPAVSEAIEEAGGVENLNRHISGQELCWALRECAMKRWGMLASTVLRSWNITRTDDFGNMVFALIESGRLQREPNDRLADFRNVFDFKETFDEAFCVEFSD